MRDAWKFYKSSPAVWSTHLLSIAAALFAPSDVLTQWPTVRRAVDGVADIFPVVRNYGGTSAFPEVTELYFTWMILMAPLWWWTAVRNRRMKASVAAWYTRMHDESYVVLRAVALIALCLPLAWFQLFINPGYDYHLLPVNSSRLALATGGPIFIHSPFWILTIPIVMLWGGITKI